MNKVAGTISTLREEMDARRANGERFNLRTIVAMMVPFITELSERHAAGESFYVYPGAIEFKPSGAPLILEIAQEAPTEARDRAALAPEQRQGGTGDTRSTVFAIGAVLYELTTSKLVGPGMLRPSEVARGIPERFELLLSKALVSDPQARPADLAALAQALHGCSPMASIPPPEADIAHLDHDEGFDVDVSLSMIPPPMTVQLAGLPSIPSSPGSDAAPTSTAAPVSTRGGAGPASSRRSTAQLAQLKAALEADPRPRYVVIKDGMDHGPFTAVELLQQIAQNQFRKEHFLRDTFSKDERQIIEWDAFAPFAEHADLNRQVNNERVALEAKVVEESHQTQNKALIGGGIFLLATAAAAGWWFRTRTSDDIRIGVSAEQAQNVDFDTGLSGAKKGAGRGKGRWTRSAKNGDSPGPSGPRPVIPGGLSCAGARARYVEAYNMGGESVPPDLTAGAYGAVLNRGSYLNSCGVPPTMSVSICAAVQNGRAVGVTVRTRPSNGGISRCISGQVRSMAFPGHPRLDVSTTFFKAD